MTPVTKLYVPKYLWFVIGLGVALDYCQSHGT